MNGKNISECNWSRNVGDANHSQYTDPAWDIMSSPHRFLNIVISNQQSFGTGAREDLVQTEMIQL